MTIEGAEGAVDVQEIPITMPFLLCRGRERRCALSIPSVVEIMRPLPIEALPNAPAFVRGLSIVRGQPIPVVDLGNLLGAESSPEPTRFVTLRTGQRHVALSVEAVLGIRELSRSSFQELPPLLRDASAEIVSAVGTLDVQLLLVLETARMISESVWELFET